MIYIGRDGNQLGPYSVEQINAMLADGQIRPADLAWWEGCTEWVPVLKVEGVVMPPPAASVSSVPSRPHATAGTPVSAYAPPRATISPAGNYSAQVSGPTLLALRETRPWVLFLAILGIILTGLMLLGGIGMLVAMAFASRSVGSPPALASGMMAGMGVMYLLIAFLYSYPIIKLFKYAGAIGRLNRSGAVRDLEDALQQQKSFWKFIGIMTAILIVIYLLVIVLAVGGGAFSVMNSRP
jgi:GYF domain 2/Family of unknown function (DUF5362)